MFNVKRLTYNAQCSIKVGFVSKNLYICRISEMNWGYIYEEAY